MGLEKILTMQRGQFFNAQIMLNIKRVTPALITA
jgi:hypothetical protein